MKRLLILSLILSIAASAYPQRWEKNEMDEFTGELVRITSKENVTGNLFYKKFSIAQNEDYFFLRVHHSGGSKTPICKNAESQIILKFISGETLTLMPTDDIDCDRNMTIIYHLTLADMQLLKVNQIEKFRIYYTEGYLDQKCSKPDYFTRTLALFSKSE
jgi:hypothetical protein